MVDKSGEGLSGIAGFPSIARLASEIDLSLTVEGVETAEQLALLRRCGIKRAQGFLFGRPQSQAAAQQAAAKRALKIVGC